MDGYYEIYRDAANKIDIFMVDNNNCLPHFHSLLELTYVVSGQIIANINGNVFNIGSGEMSIASSYDMHSFSSPNDSVSYVLQIPIQYIYKSIEQKTVAFNSFTVSDNNEQEFLHAFKMLHIYNNDSVKNKFIIKSYVSLIISLMEDSIGVTEIQNTNAASPRDVLLYISDNFQRVLTLDELSRKFGFSKYSFSRFFNSHFGCSILDYINMLRIRQAASMLKDTELLVTEIAFECGFSSLRSFYRSFQKIYKVPPNSVRRL